MDDDKLASGNALAASIQHLEGCLSALDAWAERNKDGVWVNDEALMYPRSGVMGEIVALIRMDLQHQLAVARAQFAAL